MDIKSKNLNVHQRILAVMADVDYIQKGQKMVNGSYRFVSHDQVTAKLHPYLVKHGITAVPSVAECKQEGNRTEVQLLVTFTNVDNPSDQFTMKMLGHGIGNDDKGPGKAISYAYKYALLKVFCLETGDDPDNEQNVVYEPKKCLEWEHSLPADIDMDKVEKFVMSCAEAGGKHVEDIKRDALTRLESFLQGYQKWLKKNAKMKE